MASNEATISADVETHLRERAADFPTLKHLDVRRVPTTTRPNQSAVLIPKQAVDGSWLVEDLDSLLYFLAKRIDGKAELAFDLQEDATGLQVIIWLA